MNFSIFISLYLTNAQANVWNMDNGDPTDSDSTSTEKNESVNNESENEEVSETIDNSALSPDNTEVPVLESPEDTESQSTDNNDEEQSEQDITESKQEDPVFEDVQEDDDDIDWNKYKGNFEVSFINVLWKGQNTHWLSGVQCSGDPQYYFNKNNKWGPTIGLRFVFLKNNYVSIAHNEDIIYQSELEGSFEGGLIRNEIIGLTTGLQIGAFRFNTAASWISNQYFIQNELERDEDVIRYQYESLAPLSGVFWENTLTYAPENKKVGVQLSAGFPFNIIGTRDMGEPFTSSWQASSLITISLYQIGYTYSVYPGHVLHHFQLGLGVLF